MGEGLLQMRIFSFQERIATFAIHFWAQVLTCNKFRPFTSKPGKADSNETGSYFPHKDGSCQSKYEKEYL